MKPVHFSVTDQTRRFIKRLGLPTYELEPTNPFFGINEPFILVIPTYDAEITEIVNDLPDYKSNQELLVGVVGEGDRNFTELSAYTTKDIARDYHVPSLYSFESNGVDEDVEAFKKVVEEIESKRN